MRPCRVCDTPIEPFMSFGRMPIANRFMDPKDAGSREDDFVFELAPCVCPNCGMFQLYETPDATELFHDDYAYFASVSAPMVSHFRDFAAQVMEKHLAGIRDPFVVEIGCNDGVMLRNFHARGIKHLGVEPSGNVARVAMDKGMTVRVSYFDETVASEVVLDDRRADVVLGANVIAHIADFNSVAAGVKTLLAPRGVFIFENAYLGDIVRKTSFDQLYDEHVFTFGAHSVANGFARHGLRLVDLEPRDVHCGSMRYTIAHAGVFEPTRAVRDRVNWERGLKMDSAEGYNGFKARCEAIRDDLAAWVKKTRAAGKTIAGFGATAKSTTTMNYCGIGKEELECVQDRTPAKIGKVAPGTRVPIVSPDQWFERHANYTINFAWNYRDTIERVQKAYTDRGGHWVYYIPKLEIV